MRPFKAVVQVVALLGLLQQASAACSEGVVVQLQPYEYICDGPHGPVTSVSTATRTITIGMKAQSDQPCSGCHTLTTTVATPFCKTMTPESQGSVPTVIVGIASPCHNCATLATTGPFPYITTIAPAVAGGKSTVIVCETQRSNDDMPTTTVGGPVAGTTTLPPDPGCTTHCVGTVRVTSAPAQVTSRVAGSIAGTTTILPDPGCSVSCTASVVITTTPVSSSVDYPLIFTSDPVSSSVDYPLIFTSDPVTSSVDDPLIFTSDPAISTSVDPVVVITSGETPITVVAATTATAFFSGQTAGRTTIPPSPGCTTECTATVRITSAIKHYVLLNVAGTTPGRATVGPDPGCTADCTGYVRITTVPAQVTTSVVGSVVGTTTLMPADGCSSSCDATVRITRLARFGLQTINVVGDVPGTTTILPPPDCTDDCTTMVRVTTVPALASSTATSTTNAIDTTSTYTSTSTSTSDIITTSTTTEITTTTTTTTSATSSSPLPAGACAPTPACAFLTGINVALYSNPYNDDTTPGYYSGPPAGLAPSYYIDQHLEPLSVGQDTNLQLPNIDSGPRIYGGMMFNGENHTIVAYGYFLPPTTGTYRFCMTADNVDALYFGDGSAFPCNNPAGAVRTRAQLGPFRMSVGTRCTDTGLVAGYYYPFRSVYGGFGYPNSLTVTVQVPGAEGPDTNLTPYLHIADCVG